MSFIARNKIDDSEREIADEFLVKCKSAVSYIKNLWLFGFGLFCLVRDTEYIF